MNQNWHMCTDTTGENEHFAMSDTVHFSTLSLFLNKSLNKIVLNMANCNI